MSVLLICVLIKFFNKCFLYNPLSSEAQFCDQVNQSVNYVQGYLELVILIKMRTNKPSPKSVVLEYSVKPSLGCMFGRGFKTHRLRMLGFK